jgi:hypothetical protein
VQRRRARPVSTLADLAASPATPANVLALSNPCRSARTSTTHRRCPVGGIPPQRVQRSLGRGLWSESLSNPLKNNGYSAAVSAVRILFSPPPKYLILLSYVSLRLSQKSSRPSAALRVPRGRCGRQRRLSDRRCVANPATISVCDCCSTVWKSVGGEVVGAGLASDRIS